MCALSNWIVLVLLASFSNLALAEPVAAPGYVIEEIATVPGVRNIIIPPSGSQYPALAYAATEGEQGGPCPGLPAAQNVDDEIWAVYLDGTTELFSSLPGETDIVDVAFPAPGSDFGQTLYVSGNNRDGYRPCDRGGAVLAIDPQGQFTDVTRVPPAELQEPGSFAFGQGQGFGFDMFVREGQGDMILYEYDINGNFSQFYRVNRNIQRIGAIRFSKGGAFGSYLYFTDGVCNCMRALDANGNLTPIQLTHADGFATPTFVTEGIFGEGMVFRDGERNIWRMAGDGSLLLIANGFEQMSGGNAFSIADDGQSMVVADRGTGKIYRITAAQPLPDLAAVEISVDDSRCGVSADVAAEVTNLGDAAAPAGVVVSLFDGDPAAGGALLGAVPLTRALAPGESETVRVRWHEPPLGARTLFAAVDYDASGTGSFDEVSRDNNALQAERNLCGDPLPVVDGLSCRVKRSKTSVSWNAVAGADAYRLYRHAGNGATLVTETADLLFLDSGQAPGQVFTYTVQAVAAGAAGRPSEPCAVWSQIDRSRDLPGIATTPDLTATEGIPYSYGLQGTGSGLTYSLAVAPDGMDIDANSGQVSWLPQHAGVGSVVVTVVVTNDAGRATPQSWLLNVRDTNNAPVIDSNPITTGAADTQYSYSVLASDLDGDGLTYGLGQAPSGMTIDPVSGLILWTPTVLDVGTHDVEVRVGDSFGGIATQSYMVTVAAQANQAPFFTSNPVLTVRERANYLYDATADDPDLDALTFSLTTAPNGMAVNPTLGSVTWTPAESDLGDHPVVLRVADPLGLFAEQSFTVTVTDFNFDPVINTNPVLLAVLNELYQYTVVATDADNGDVLTYSLAVAPAGMTIDPTTGVLLFTPTQLGDVDVTVLVEDGNGGSASQSFVLSIGAPPEITSVPLTLATQDSLYTYDVDATDANGDVLTYSFDMAPDGMLIDPVTGLIQWVPDAGQVGDHDVMVRVTDTTTLFALQPFTVTVLAPNAPPNITSTPATATQSDVLYEYQIVAVDGNNDALAFSLDVAPLGMTVNPASGLVQWTATDADAGLNDVTVRVEDGRGGFATQNYAIFVSAPPRITSAPVTTATQDAPYAYDVEAQDANGDVLTYSLDNAPAGMAIDPLTGVISWTPAANQTGIQSVAVRVADPAGLLANQAYAVQVANVNDAPSAEAGSTQSVRVGEAAVLDGSASSDLDGDVLTYAWFIQSAPVGSVATLSVPDAVMPSLTPDVAGDYVVELVVNDGVLDSAPDTVVVSTLNSAPVADAGPDTTTVTGGNVVLDGSGSLDIDADPLTFQWSFVSRPAGSTTVLVGADAVGPSFVADRPGDYVVQLIVADGALFSAPDQVTVSTINSAPVANAGVDLEALAGELVQLDGSQSTDVDFDTLTFAWALTSVPVGSSASLVGADSASPVLTPDLEGTYVAQLIVNDGSVDSAPDTVTLTVLAAVVPVPDVVGATQSDAEAQIVAAGLVVGTVAVQASDTVAAGSVIDQGPAAGAMVPRGSAVDLTVSQGPADADTLRPEVTLIAAPGDVVEVGEDIALQIVAVDDTAVASIELFVDNASQVLDANNIALFSSIDPGVFLASAVVTDTAGNQAVVTREIRFIEAGDATPPTAVLIAPARDAVLEEPTDVIGTADDANLVRYVLELSRTGADQFVQIASGTSGVVNNVLGSVDPTLYRNGLYDLRLTVEDISGNVSSDQRTVNFDGELKIGRFEITYSDMVVPVSGIPISILRTYDSHNRQPQDFGFGWSIELKSMDVQENVSPAEGWETFCTNSIFGVCLEYGIRSTTEHLVVITRANGQKDEFLVDVNTTFAQPNGLAQGNLRFDAQPGTFSSLQSLDSTQFDFLQGGELLDLSFTSIDPMRYRLTDTDGTAYDIVQGVGVERIEDTNGNVITITSNGIVHSTGRSVLFERDTDNRITRVTDPEGNSVNYEYDFYGDLVAVTDRDGNRTQFTYNSSHGLLDIIDPRGVMPARNEYDSAGRLVAVIDADGNRLEIEEDPNARTEIIRNRLGHATVKSMDARGNVVSETTADGATITRTFDANDNKLSETDGEGNTTTYTYDARDNRLTETDALGNTTLYTYDGADRLLTMTDAAGGVVSRTYDADGNLTSSVDAEGNSTVFTYDGRGNALSRTDALGNVHTFAYNANGDLIGEVDAEGNSTTHTYDSNGRRLTSTESREVGGVAQALTTTFTYDANGRLLRTTHPDGTADETEYDPVGNVTAMVDRLGRRTSHQYDDLNRRVRTVYPDGTEETREYDAESQLTRVVDQLGNAAAFTYDELGRLASTTNADGGVISYSYDLAGRLVSETDENGNVRVQEFDAAGRVTRTVDALGRATLFTYDALGNPQSTTDARGNTTTYEYDGNLNPTRTVFADGSEVLAAYDAMGRLVAETDRGGDQVQVGLDSRGHRQTLTDELGNVWQFAYDEQGNRISRTDPLGNTTAYAYDQLGQEVTRTLPDGAVQTRSYDDAGNLVLLTDYSGAQTVFAYDDLDRLVSRTYPDGSADLFTYTASGQRASATDARGVTTYTYDDRDRLTGVTQPDGSQLTYVYDSRSNLTAITAAVGGDSFTTSYTYDVEDRLVGVGDEAGNSYGITYDDSDNRTQISFPNGVSTSFAYDSLDQLVNLATQNAGGVLQTFAYTLDAKGYRTLIEEADGTDAAYSYDAAGRLLDEDVTQGASAVLSNSFTYDAAGNRAVQESSVAGGASTFANYSYDNRDRLLSAGTTTYSWDQDGRLISRSGADGATHVWNVAGELVATTHADGTVVTHEYDVDGNRVATSVAPASGPPVVTRYLVDIRGFGDEPVSQVVAEIDAAGDFTANYVRAGSTLLSVLRPTETRYYHADGLGSIRLLTDATGTVVQEYDYDAFGTLISSTGSDPNPYLFAGEAHGPKQQLSYNRARWLDPASGRFMSIDPLDAPLDLEGLPLPSGINRYHYVSNNPVNATDPTGELISFISPGIQISFRFSAGAFRTQSGRVLTQRLIQRLASNGRFSVRDLRNLRNRGNLPANSHPSRFEIHHLIEQRLLRDSPALRRIFNSADDIPGVNITRAQHRVFTNAWRDWFPRRGQRGFNDDIGISDLRNAAKHIYKDHPEMLRAVLIRLI